jgi:hypothetical protein
MGVSCIKNPVVASPRQNRLQRLWQRRVPEGKAFAQRARGQHALARKEQAGHFAEQQAQREGGRGRRCA